MSRDAAGGADQHCAARAQAAAAGNRVVTIIEFLSPSNKSPGSDREQYLRKQREVCSSEANLVEIDLNRFGIHALAFPLE